MGRTFPSSPATATLTRRIQARLNGSEVSVHHREWGKAILSAIETFAESSAPSELMEGSKVVSTHDPDTGVLLIEWVFPEYRLSYWIEKDVRHSSWSFASNERIDQNGYGGLTRPTSIGVGLALLRSVYA